MISRITAISNLIRSRARPGRGHTHACGSWLLAPAAVRRSAVPLTNEEGSVVMQSNIDYAIMHGVTRGHYKLTSCSRRGA